MSNDTELSEIAKEWLVFLGLDMVNEREGKFFMEAETSPNYNLRWEMHQCDWEELGAACAEIAEHLESLGRWRKTALEKRGRREYN